MFLYTCSHMNVLIFGNNFKFIRTRFLRSSDSEGHNFHAIFGDNLGGVGGLVDDETSAELDDALVACFNSLLEGHVCLEVVVKDGVDKVGSVPVGALADALEATKVV